MISDIDKNITKFKILKPDSYIDSLETALSNSNITKFYKRYYNIFHKNRELSHFQLINCQVLSMIH
jgi:hypothetical protein